MKHRSWTSAAGALCMALVLAVVGTGCRQPEKRRAFSLDDTSLRVGERGLASAGESVVIATAARTRGSAGTNWRTDVVVLNPGSIPATYTIALLVRDAQNGNPVTVTRTLAAGEAEFLGDVLDLVFDFDGAAALRISAIEGTVAVNSRTYNLLGPGNDLGLPAGSTFGQFVPALCDDDAVGFGDEGRLIQLAHDKSLETGGRTNIILVNGADGTIEVEVDLHDGDGTHLGTVTRSLRSWEYRQINKVFEKVTGRVITNGYAVVRTTTSGGRFYALASVVDNLTGDPITITAALALPLEERYFPITATIPASARIKGNAGTNWRTDLVLNSLHRIPWTVDVELLPRDQENVSPPKETITISPGESLEYRDVFQSLFSTDGAGALRIMSYVPLSVSSRTYNLLGAGNEQGLPEGSTFGQYIGAVDWGRAIVFGEAAWLPHLWHDPTLEAGSRANLTLVNNSNRAIDIVVELFLEDGTSLGTYTKRLKMWENHQINRVFEKVTRQKVDHGYAVVHTTHPAGTFHAIASVVDNITGDPITVDAIVLRKASPSGLVATVNDVLSVFGSDGLTPTLLFDLLASPDLDGVLDDAAAGSPEYYQRTANGLIIDYGHKTVLGTGTSAGGTLPVSLSGIDASGGSLSGRVVLDLDDFHFDGRAPVVDAVQLDLDLEQVGRSHVAGTVTLGSPAKAEPVVQGELEFDTRICESFPVGGSITVTIDGEPRTVSFSEACNRSFNIDIPTIEYLRYRMRVRECTGAWQGEEEIIHLVSEDGALSVDPSSPQPNQHGVGRYSAMGTMDYGDVELMFGAAPGWPASSERRRGRFFGERSTYGDVWYYTGTYSYTMTDGGCFAQYIHRRSDPDFWAAILEPCNGSCVD